MSIKLRNVLSVAVVTVALGLSTGASAGITGKLAEKLHDQRSDQQVDKKSSSTADRPHSSGPKRSSPPPQPARGDSSRGRSSSSSGSPNPSRGTFGSVAGPARNSQRDSQSGDRDRGRSDRSQGDRDRNSSHDLSGDLARLQGRSSDRDGGRGHDDHNRRSRVVERLPSGYRDYYWNGNRYYAYGGNWYRPYGSTYITIGNPYGLFVTSLPGSYSSFWFDDTRYFYSDSTYYVYEPVRRGYVVSRSPYGDDERYDAGFGDDLYIYPAQGQSEQQQADDRYECHRWGVDQTDYDPLNDEYDADLRADYVRAMSACLTGRGYTVN